MSEPSITDLLAAHGIRHERDKQSSRDYKHSLFDRHGNNLGRFDVFEACTLLERINRSTDPVTLTHDLLDAIGARRIGAE